MQVPCCICCYYRITEFFCKFANDYDLLHNFLQFPDTLNPNIPILRHAKKEKESNITLSCIANSFTGLSQQAFFPLTISIKNLQYISVSVTMSPQDLGYRDFLHYITCRLLLLSYVSKKKHNLPNLSLSFAMTL